MQHSTLSNRYDYTWLTDSIFLIASLSILFFVLLGSRALFVPDEGRYAEIAREMVSLGDYITPHLDGIKYFEKPILYYWLMAAAIKIAGLSLWSIRSINAGLALLGCLITYFVGRKLFDRSTGLLASLILSTSTLYFMLAHMISLDLTVTFFLSTSLFAFLLGCYTPIGIKRRLYIWCTFASAALAVLTKGLIGIVFPIMIIGTWVTLLNEWRLLKNLYLPSGLFIFLLITVPWHLLVGWKNPEFFYFYFIEQHFLRYTTEHVGHYQPAWFFIPVLILGFFPWVAFLPQTIVNLFRKQGHQFKLELFFLLWALLIFIFFSISKSKLIPYILPIFVPLAILIARYLTQTIFENTYKGIRIDYIGLLILSCIIAIVFYLLPMYAIFADEHTAIFYLYMAAVILLAGTFIASVYAFQNSHLKAILILLLTTSFFLLTTLMAVPAIDTRTILPLASMLNPILSNDDEVITFNQYYHDLPFYLKRKVSILNWRNELSYGIKHQDSHEWMLDDTAFWQVWRSSKRVFVMMGIEEFKQFKEKNKQEKPYVIGKTKTNILISNKASG